MLIHPQFNPNALSFGPIAIRWYALSYIVGFILFIWLGRRRIKKGGTPFTNEMLDDLLTWGVLGVILGGRIGNFINGELWGRITDPAHFWAMGFPQAKSADTALAHANPQYAEWLLQYGALPRHPSQLYQFALEGMTLFFIVWWFSAKPRPEGQVSMVFLGGYGLFRFIAEYARQPDAHLDLFMGLSRGQWLSVPMIVLGVIGFVYFGRRNRHAAKA